MTKASENPDRHCLETITARIRNLCRPMDPQDTGGEAKLQPIPGIRAVLFDVYGTLFISGSGDIGVLENVQSGEAVAAALSACGFSCTDGRAGRRGLDVFMEQIRQAHSRLKEQGIAHPEVEIRVVWKDVVRTLLGEGLIAGEMRTGILECVAVEYECRTNPVWPMPHALDVLHALREKGRLLGLISNAQFYTPLLFNALMGASPGELGFESSACIYSYNHWEAKPSVGLFLRAAQRLSDPFEIKAREILYVGNDMLNDIGAAAQAGCRTVLFAGDRRSLRLREDDERCANVVPDAVITSLDQLPGLLG